MKTFYKILTLAIFAIGLTSCLKDEMIEKQERGMINLNANKILELPPSTAFLLPYSEEEEELDFITVNLAAEQPAQEDITVQLSLDDSDALIADYNAANAGGPTVVGLPADFYSFVDPSGLTVTIPKGSKTATVKIKLKSSDLNADLTYGLGVKIVSVDKPGYIVSGNLGSDVIRVGAQNQYHGTYTHTYNSSLGEGTNEVDLITLGANAVTLDPGLLGLYSNAVTLTIDPVTYQVTVSMTTLLPIATDPSSHYDPATRTFHLKWTSNGGNRFFEETFVRK